MLFVSHDHPNGLSEANAELSDVFPADFEDVPENVAVSLRPPLAVPRAGRCVDVDQWWGPAVAIHLIEFGLRSVGRSQKIGAPL